MTIGKTKRRKTLSKKSRGSSCQDCGRIVYPTKPHHKSDCIEHLRDVIGILGGDLTDFKKGYLDENDGMDCLFFNQRPLL